jgi:hypothetical protein
VTVIDHWDLFLTSPSRRSPKPRAGLWAQADESRYKHLVKSVLSTLPLDLPRIILRIIGRRPVRGNSFSLLRAISCRSQARTTLYGAGEAADKTLAQTCNKAYGRKKGMTVRQ